MKVIIFGATGMVGSGVLRECLLDPDVETVTAILRRPTGQKAPKLTERIHPDIADVASYESELSGYDACFFCLGISSFRMSEADYRRITYDLTLAVAKPFARLNPEMTFVYLSGTGADRSEKGRVMWARVRGALENRLLELPFKAVYIFRPGYIQPLHGSVSRTKIYKVMYDFVGWLYPILKTLTPNYVTTTEQVGKAMIGVVKGGFNKKVLENGDINCV